MPFWDIENLRRTSRQLASTAERAREIRESHATKRGGPGAGESGLSRLRRLFSRSKARMRDLPVEDDLPLGQLSEHDISRRVHTRRSPSAGDGRDRVTSPNDADLGSRCDRSELHSR
jgi:hypothetical protein